MPYNLRKRKAVEVVEPAQTPAKKKRKEKVLKSEPTSIEENHIEPEPVEESKIKKLPKAPARKKKEEKPKPKTKRESKVKEDVIEEPELDKKDLDKKTSESPPSSPASKKTKTNLKTQLIFGEDTCGELGLGEIGISKKSPTVVPINKPIRQIACGPVHTLTLTEDGEIYSYGCNDEGALGRPTDGDETLEATPTVVPLDAKVIKITAGDSHSAALTDDQKVYIWGNFRDEHGPIGLTPANNSGEVTLEPTLVSPEIKFKDIASGSNHMLLLDVDGAVYSFGVGAQGQLGRLTTDDVGDAGDKPITNENRKLFLTPQLVNLKTVDPQRPFVCDAVYAGNFSSFATNTDKKKNRLAAWGLNNYFQLGYKGLKNQLVQHKPKRSTFTCSTSIKGVACGPHHTIFLTKTGRVYAAGRDEYGMLGLGKVGKEVCPAKSIDSLGNTIVEVSAGINTSFAVSNDGELYSWGMGGINLGLQNDKDLIVPTHVECLKKKKVLSVSTGGSFTSVLVEDL